MVHVGGADGHDKARIETELDEPVHRNGPRFNFCEILPDPHHGPSRGRAADEPYDKTRCRSTLPTGFRKHLVNGAQSEPTLQARVGLRMSERCPARWIRLIARLEALDAAA